MLYLIGLGLDKKDISLKGLEAVRKCDFVYLETYTNIFSFSQKDIEKVIGKKAIRADRKEVEEGKEIIENAKKKSVALLVSGDPLSATTHVELVLRAKKEKIKVKVIHSTSVFNAISETGLQLYKFGKTASIARWQPNFQPESFYDIIKDNLKIHAHSLVLIDIGLPVKEALGYIDSIAKMRDPEMIERKIIVCENLGEDKQKISYGKLEELLKKKYSLPACIIIPGSLHFMEIEALDKFSS
jgi:diphthine synthase